MQRYHEALWTRGPLLFDPVHWAKEVAKVERGQAALKESSQACAALAIRLARSLPSYSAPAHLLPPGAGRSAPNTQLAPSVDSLASIVQVGVPLATNPWHYIPLSYSGAVPWSHSTVPAARPLPKFMTLAPKVGSSASSGAVIISPHSTSAPTALPSISWSVPTSGNTKSSAPPHAKATSSVANSAASGASMTLSSILCPALDAAATHRSSRLFTEHAVLAQSREGFSASNDAFLLCSVLRHGGIGACSFERVAADIRADPSHALDVFFLSRSPDQLEARAKVLLRAVFRDVADTQRSADKVLADQAKAAQRKVNVALTKVSDAIARAVTIGRIMVDKGELLTKSKPAVKAPTRVETEDIDDGPAPAVAARSLGAAVDTAATHSSKAGKAAVGSKTKTVPDVLIGALVRVILSAETAGVDHIVDDFLTSAEVLSYAEREAAATAVNEGAELDADAIAADAERLKPSKKQVKYYVTQLAFKDNSALILRSKWRLRSEFAALATMSDADAATWIAAHPIPPQPVAKPKIKSEVAGTAGEDIDDAADQHQEAKGGGVAADVEPVAAPKLSPPALAVLASLIAKAGAAGIQHIVDEFHAYSKSFRGLSKLAVQRDIKVIATKDRGPPDGVKPPGLIAWRLLPEFAYLQELPLPPRDESDTEGDMEDSSNARGVEPGSEGLETGPASGAAPAGSLMGLAGAEKPRLSL